MRPAVGARGIRPPAYAETLRCFKASPAPAVSAPLRPAVADRSDFAVRKPKNRWPFQLVPVIALADLLGFCPVRAAAAVGLFLFRHLLGDHCQLVDLL